MPEFSGPKAFSNKQAEAIISRLEKQTKDICPRCGHDQMVVMEGIAMIRMLDPRTLQARMLLPNIVILCADCGLTQLFNVHALGLGEVVGLQPGEPITSGQEAAGREGATHE